MSAPGTYQGDIRMDPAEYETIFGAARHDRRLGSADEAHVPLWRGERDHAGFVVRYTLDEDDPEEGANTMTAEHKARVEASMRGLEADLGGVLTFQPAVAGRHYIRIGSFGPGCWSYVGRRDAAGPQALNLASGCDDANTVHELMHALGFFHEQSRSDRDAHVAIVWDNIDPDRWSNFDKADAALDSRHTPYDYDSIMHYSSHAFALDTSRPTILASRPLGGGALSHMDVTQARMLYRCAEGTRDHYGDNCSRDCPCRSGEGVCAVDAHCLAGLHCDAASSLCALGPSRTEADLGIILGWMLLLPLASLGLYRLVALGCERERAAPVPQIV